MAGLNENHKRRLLSAFSHADGLLNRSLDAVEPSRPCLLSHYIQDMSPSDAHFVESHIEKIRDQMNRLLQRFEIERPAPSIASSWVLRTSLISFDTALEDLCPDKMKGYGSIDEPTSKELSLNLEEIRRLLNQLYAFLADTETP